MHAVSLASWGAFSVKPNTTIRMSPLLPSIRLPGRCCPTRPLQPSTIAIVVADSVGSFSWVGSVTPWSTTIAAVFAAMTCSTMCFKMLDSFKRSCWLGTWLLLARSNWFGVGAGGTCWSVESWAFLERQVGLLNLPCLLWTHQDVAVYQKPRMRPVVLSSSRWLAGMKPVLSIRQAIGATFTIRQTARSNIACCSCLGRRLHPHHTTFNRLPEHFHQYHLSQP